MVERRRALSALTALLVLVAAARAQGGLGTDHVSPMPFLMNVRYGRSPAAAAERHLEPRAGRFFMGSRYGKRSEGGGAALVCEYTGVMALYHCYRGPRTRLRDDADNGRRLR